MDDLISRWAAIDALTDTNLKRNVDSVCDGDMNRTRRAAQRVIAQLPAIEAIPVEWLKAQIAPYMGDVSDLGKGAHNATIKNLIRKWQNEQEGKR